MTTTTQPFLLNPWNATLLTDSSRPFLSGKMVYFLLRILFAILCMFFPAGFFLFMGFLENQWTSGQIIMIVTGATLALLGLATASSATLAEYRLIRFGYVITGEIISFHAVKNTYENEPVAGGSGGSWSETTVTVEYAFVSPTGERLSDTIKTTNVQVPEPPPQSGDPVAALYLDDTNYQVL